MDADLNLLRVFDTLFEERSVTKAAERLNLTQSAVSHALARLRQTMDDVLFVRGPGGLQPTARAAEIAPGIHEGLTQLRMALSPTLFDPRTAERQFNIAAGSYFCTLLVPELIATVRKTAPGITIRITPQTIDLPEALDSGSVDLALGVFEKLPSRMERELLYREQLVWIAAKDGPLAREPFSLPDMLKRPRVVISTSKPFAEARPSIGEEIERRLLVETQEQDRIHGDEAERPVYVYDAATAIAIVSRSDMVALTPRRFAEHPSLGEQVTIVRSATAPGIDLSMLWHGKFSQEPGLLWLRGLVAKLARRS